MVTKKTGIVIAWFLLPLISGGWGYDHNFLRFLPIFGEKIGVFSQKQMLWSIFFKKLAVVWAKNCEFFRKIFCRKYLKNHNIGPGIALCFRKDGAVLLVSLKAQRSGRPQNWSNVLWSNDVWLKNFFPERFGRTPFSPNVVHRKKNCTTNPEPILRFLNLQQRQHCSMARTFIKVEDNVFVFKTR
jgi:hypothetical protein